MICCILYSVTIILFLQKGAFCEIITGPSNATIKLGETYELKCVANETYIPIWDEVFGDGRFTTLFRGNRKDSLLGKYSNFDISGPPPNYNLKINQAQIEDEGLYRCATTEADSYIASLSIEAEVRDITISCTPPCAIENGIIAIEEMTECMCVCHAVGGYPDSLMLEWNKGSSGIQTISIPGPDGSYDFSKNVTFTTLRNYQPLKCEMSGYTIDSINVSRDIQKQVSFDILYAPDCRVVTNKFSGKYCNGTFSCDCKANPTVDATRYSYYKNNVHINGSSNKIKLDFEPGEDTGISCKAGNDVGVGKQSPEAFFNCSGQSQTGVWIAFIVLLWFYVTSLVVISVYCYKKRSKSTSSKRKNQNAYGKNDPLEYAAVTEPLKTEPNAAPRSSELLVVGTSSAGGEPEKMELQFADIDHGYRGPSNEIRQPADAPTEYATVQSVNV